MLESLISASTLPKFEPKSVIQGPRSPAKSDTCIKQEPEPIDFKMEPEANATREEIDQRTDIKQESALRLRNDGLLRIAQDLPVAVEHCSTPPLAHSNVVCSSRPDSCKSPLVHNFSTRPSVPTSPLVNMGPASPTEPADLSNKKPENVTCVPEIDFIKEEIDDAASDYSNSSDPDRLEVDMSQVYYKNLLCRVA